MILRPNIPAGNSYIQVIDRVLDIPSDKSVLGYISLSEQSDTAFYREILQYITGEGDYTKTVDFMNTRPRITVFVPTREAIGRIPKEKLDLLRGNPSKLNEVAQMHIIEDQVVYTSFVYHNEGINNLGKGQVIFRTNTAREAVFVSSGGVTAQVVRGNITCRNGAIHFIDTLLGYKYNTAKDEIWLNPITRTFKQVLERSRNELQNAVVAPSGVTLFVPTDTAFRNVPSYNNIMTNISLINKMMELSMLEPGQEIELTGVNGAYEARLSLTSQYFRNPIQVYSQGNETWIESGYVKARVVRPDVGVTNGYVHIIDAVPGVPSRDIPNTIFCEDWLIKSSLQLAVTGLNDYMRDVRLNSIAPCTTSSGIQSAANVYTAFANPSYSLNQQGSSQGSNTQGRPCGSNCFFTVFIPNGTAIDNFENMIAGKQIQADNGRWQNVLMRHITRQRIYLDQTAIGVERIFTALNGDQVRYRRATTRYAYLYYKGRQSRVIHSDIGGTNGVIHIIDAVIFTSDDLYALSSSPSSHSLGVWSSLLSLCLFMGNVLRRLC
ncbi:fasciclin-1-like isoform X4 [Littorina saxatilis]|uniref:fasciclin-1-like isoform X4 n=1 Tax=Littorina saxatilis TaxID=31220 RepID=UPI0038B66F63